ncbi:MAG: hypothetical protein IJ583_03515, partial [Firmicutes bacterium]|nr:hypothetical protein [Bacillota bacterium]
IKEHIKNVISLDDILKNIDVQAINSDRKMQITEVQNQLTKKAEYKAALYENFVSGVLDKYDYKALKMVYSKDEQQLRETLAKLEQELDEYLNNTEKKTLWAEHFKRFADVEELDRSTVVQLILNITIFDKKYLQITFNFDDDYKSMFSEDKSSSNLHEIKDFASLNFRVKVSKLPFTSHSLCYRKLKI